MTEKWLAVTIAAVFVFALDAEMDLSRRLSLVKLQLRLALSGPKTLDLQQSQLVVQLGSH